MQPVNLQNKELLGILNKFLAVLLNVDRSKFPYKEGGSKTHLQDMDSDYACSEEYLKYMQGKQVDGFPEETCGVDMMRFNPPYQSLRDALRVLDTELLAWTGSRNNAVKMLYPQGGYMGWHHNANAPGYNILLSWSKEGKGYFRYQNPVTKEIVTMHDTPGWTCKAGYYGRFDEPNKIYWHCANAKEEERLTLGYIIPHEAMWQSMVDDIETP